MSTSNPEPLTLERIFDSPDINGQIPIQPQWSPDGQFVSCLRSRDDNFERLHLYVYEVANHSFRLLVDADRIDDARALSDEEKANRERRRITAGGIVEYVWSPQATHLLFPVSGRLYQFCMEDSSLEPLTAPGRFVTSPRYSPDGFQLAFIDNGDLYVLDVAARVETRVTTRTGASITNGVADFIAQEEMHRFDGYWWSPDSTRIAFVEVDESPIAVTQRYEIDADEFGVFDQRYPYAGAANATCRLGIAEIDSHQCTWVDAGIPADGYLGRVNWLDAARLVTQTQSRLQDKLYVNVVDIKTPLTRCIIEETSSAWINLNSDFKSRDDGNRFIWRSDRDGYAHLYEVETGSGELTQLTQGPWCVHSLRSVSTQHLYFEAFADSPLEKHLYRRDWSTGTATRLTTSGQYHLTAVSPDESHFIDTVSAVDMPPTLTLESIEGHASIDIINNRLTQDHPFAPFQRDDQAIEFGTLEADDGQILHYRLVPPVNRQQGERYPVIVTVYGGPGAQLVTRQWLSPWQRYMSARGFGLFQLDNRGSANRGNRFEQAIHGELGTVEVRDQLLGVDWLRSLPWVESARIGVFGHSYGGYMTLMLMSKASDVFAAGVSVAPVTDWLLYDTHYTERYLGLPSANVNGYQQSSIFAHVGNLTGKLLIVHGMADDNVLFTNTTRLSKVLQDQNIQFDMMTYPGAKHGLAGRQVNIHRYTLMDQFFDEHLGKH